MRRVPGLNDFACQRFELTPGRLHDVALQGFQLDQWQPLSRGVAQIGQASVPPSGAAECPFSLVCPCAVTAGLLLDCLCVQGKYPACQLADTEGKLLTRRARLIEGQAVRVVGALTGEASALGGSCLEDVPLLTLMSKGMPASIRARLMDFQDGWAADDQIAFALARLADTAGVYVVDPLQATQAIAARSPTCLPALPRADCKPWQVVTAVCLKGHWVTFHWSYAVGRLTAWSSDPSTTTPDIDLLHSLFAQAVRASLRQFRFAQATTIEDEPGQCGWLALQALADRCLLKGAEAWVARVIGDCHEAVSADGNVRAPVLLGGSPLAMLARDGINRIGAPAVQHGMQGAHPWRQLKQVANQASPVFQWVLPVEMQAQIQARVDSGVPLPAKKKPNKKTLGAQRVSVQLPVLPQPEQFQVPHGVFVAGSPPQQLGQIALKDIGPQAVGVVLATRDAAEPYLHLPKAVVVGPLPWFFWGRMTYPPLQRTPLPFSFPPIASPQVSRHSSRPCLFNWVPLRLLSMCRLLLPSLRWRSPLCCGSQSTGIPGLRLGLHFAWVLLCAVAIRLGANARAGMGSRGRETQCRFLNCGGGIMRRCNFGPVQRRMLRSFLFSSEPLVPC